MNALIKKIHHLLIQQEKTVSAAESCTGGLLSYLFTQTPGSSAYFRLGIIAYSNEIKEKNLRISPSIIKKHGAVSRETAKLMAARIRTISKTDFGIGITGIAGPKSGSLKKPVGTVFIAIDSKHKNDCRKFNFKGRRQNIRKQSALEALKLLYQNISGKNPGKMI